MQLDKMKANSGLLLLAFGATLVVAGCADTPYEEPAAQAVPQHTQYVPDAVAGVPVAMSQDPERFRQLVATRSVRFPTRPDPFALTRREAGFEGTQGAERLFSEMGPFSTEFPPPADPPVVVPVVEPQPYRRLSGIVVGDSVLALIDMGDGNGPLIIRPGMRIPNSPWRVISIDEEKAILRRDGDVHPREITVRLEVPPPGFGGGGGAPAPGGGDGTGGRDDGGAPPGAAGGGAAGAGG